MSDRRSVVFGSAAAFRVWAGEFDVQISVVTEFPIIRCEIVRSV